MTGRIRNFYPGPCALPRETLDRIRDELTDYRGTGMSVMEISHRAAPVVELFEETVAALKRIMKLDDDYEVLLLPGGASLQFSMIPLNLSRPGETAAYVDSGLWAEKATAEAKRLNRRVVVVGSSAPEHRRIPDVEQPPAEARYLHLCTNNTIVGTQFHAFPDTPAPLAADASSDFLSREIDYRRFALIYAHAQKSFGASGVTIVVLRRDLLDAARGDEDGEALPTMLDYRVHLAAKSIYNTPPVFAVYVVRLVLEWLETHIGGPAAMERINRVKASTLYDLIDRSGFYSCSVEKPSRSLSNVVFRLPTVELEKRFVDEAEAAGLVGLAGHRRWGGCRASLFNTVTVEDVRELAGFMEDFAARCG